MPIATDSKAAFRCHNCGHLVGPESAGELHLPLACPVCHYGIRFSPSGERTEEPDNWEVLCRQTPERLAEIGLTPEDVVEHTPVPKEHNVLAAIDVFKTNLDILAQKRQHWEANKDVIVKEFTDLLKKRKEVEAKIAGTLNSDVPASVYEGLVNDKNKIEERLYALANMEPTAQDDRHEAKYRAGLTDHEAWLKTRQNPAQQTLKAQLRDGAGVTDDADIGH